MTNLTSLIAIFLLSISFAFAAVDLSSFELKPHQINLIRKLEVKGKSEAELLKMARGFHLYNTTGSSQENPRTEYIPPHTFEELLQTKQWAKGAALFTFIKYTSYSFDGEKYRSDCPNWAIFNFGRATGTEFIKVDVLLGVTNLLSELQRVYSNSPDSFEEKFIQIAKREKLDQYIY